MSRPSPESFGGDGRRWPLTPPYMPPDPRFNCIAPPLSYDRGLVSSPHLPSSRHLRLRSDTASTMSDRFSRVITSPARGVPDPVVFNAGFTFRLTEEKPVVYNHLKVDPAFTVPHTQSSNLTAKIDKFLRRSVDRFENTSNKTINRRSTSRTSDVNEVSRFSNDSSLSLSPKPSRALLHSRPLTPSSPLLSSNRSAFIAERNKRILSKVVANGTKHHRQRTKDISSSTSSSTGENSETESDASPQRSNESHNKSDTSAEISKLSNMAVNRTSKANASNDSSTLEDLSSGSDDDFYDVHPLPGYFCIPGRPQLGFRDHYGGGIGGLTIAPGRPFIVGPPPPSPRGPVPHSYSLPAVNKLKPTTKLGNSLASPQLKGRKKYPAPPPPLSREGSFVSNESSIQNCGVDGSPATNKKPQRSPSLKKYPAPQPPLSSAPTNGQTVMFKTSSLPRDTSRRSLHCEPTSLNVVNGSTNYCSSSSQHSSTRDESQTRIMSPLLIAGDIVSENNKASLSHRDSKIISKETEKTFESQAVKVSSILSPNDIEKRINEPLTVTNSSNLKSEFSNSKTSDVSNASLNTNHSEVLSCQLSSGKDVSRPELLDVSCSAADYNLNKVNKDTNIKELGSNNPVLPTDNKLEMGRKKRHNKSTNDLQKDTNKVSSRRGSSSREDDKSSQGSSRSSSRGVTPDPSGNVKIGSVKTKSGKLAALANRFEDDKSKPNEVRSKPPPPKPIVINLGKKSASSLVTGMASRFGGDGPKPKETTKVQSPYSKPFEPQSTLQEKKKNSIGGITVASKFGDIVKPINFKKVKEKEQKTLTTPVIDNNDESEISKDVKRSNHEANSVAVDKVIKNVEKPTNEKDRLNKKKKMKEERLSDVIPDGQVDVTSAEKVVEEKKEKLLTIETSLSETGVNVSGVIANNIKNSHQQNPNNSEHNQEELKNSLSKADVPKEMSHLDGTINKDLKIDLLTKENLSSKDITISNSETDTTSIKQSTGTQVLTKNFEQEKSNYGSKHISTKLNSKNALQNLPKEVDLVVDPKSATKEDLKAASNNVPKNIADIPEEGALDESTTNNVHETVSNSIPANIINVSEKTADPVVGSVLKDTPENNIKIVPVKTANDDLENISENASEKDPDNAINNVLESVSIDVTENEKVVSESGLKNSLKSISGNGTALLSESLSSKLPVQETLKNSKEYDSSEILNSTNISEVLEPEIKSLTQKEEIPIIIETETKESKIQVESTKSINDACTIMENNDKIPEVLPQLNDIANSAQSESAVSSPRDINITTNDSNLTENTSLDITASLKNEDNSNENQNIVLNEVQTASESEDKIESSKESNANDLLINTDLISSNLKLLEETSISDTSISPLLDNSDIETLKIAVQSTNNELTGTDNTKPIITRSTTLARLVDNESIDQLSIKLKLECSGDEISDLNPQVIHERLEIPVTIAFDDNENSPSVPSDHFVASRKIITSLPSDSIYLPSKLSKEIQSLRHVDSVIFGPGSVSSSLGNSGLNSYKSNISEYNTGTTTSALSTMPLLSQGTLPSSVSSSITSSDKATTQKPDAQEDSILSPTSLLQGMVNSLKTSFSKVLLNSTNNSNQQASTVSQDNMGTNIAIPVNLEILNNKLSSEVKVPSTLSENESISSMERRGARSKKSPRNIAIPDEVLYVSDIIKNAEERLNVALQKNPLKIKNSDGKEEIFLDAFDSTQFDTLMPLPLSEELNPSDYRSRSCTPFRESFERAATPSRAVQQTEAILSETDRILRKTRSQHSLRRSFTRSLSGISINRLAEVSADLNEEHSTSHMAGERIEAEQAERMRLEKEVSKLQLDVKQMTNVTDQLEMEKLALRSEVLQHSELNGDFNDLDEAADASLYKRKYEWCIREMEVLKKQLKQQQEDDYDQLIILKKQLEKKVSDAYEETDEQRQIVGQLKKKSQRLQAEMNDMKILLEEQTSRNNLLEKKQRKFDQDMLSVQEDHRNERLTKDKIQREKDQILSEKYSYEQEVSTLKLELDLKEEKINSLTKELNDLSFTGKAEEEVALLKKAKHDLELRVKDQEEELDDLAGQVQMLEGAKIRLEMSIEQMRKENRKEAQQREEEIEEIRMGAQKKLKALESQLECEHEERTQLVREKHDLERRLADAHERTFATVDEDSFHKVKKELKKTKALLKDTQTMLEKTQSEGSNKLLLRQLKTQLEDVEFAKTAAVKARQSAESDLTELQIQLDEVSRAKKDSEERCLRLSKEKTEIQTQLEESEEEVAEVMKKYKATVSQLSVDQINISEQSQIIADLEHDKQILSDRLTEMTSKVEVLEGETANIHTQRRLQMKIKELESKLELEQTTKTRLESQISRLKDQVEKVCSEMESIRLKESQAGDYSKKLNRQLRESKEDFSNLQQKHTDAISRKQDLEKQQELSESEIITLKSDLKLAFKRIEDLQQALQGDLSDSDTELTDSNAEMLVCSPTTAQMMSAIREDEEDEDFKESFA